MNLIFNKKFLYLFFFLFLLFLIFYLAETLFPFFIGLFVAYLLDPIVDFLEKHKIKRVIATSITLILFFFIIFILVFFIFPILLIQVRSFLLEFPNIISELNLKLSLIIEYLQRKAFFESNTEQLNSLIPNLSNFITRFLQNIISSSLAIFSVITVILITPIVSWYFLKDWDNIVINFKRILPLKYKKTFVKYAKEINIIFSAYLRGQILVSLSLSFFYFFSFYIIGLKYSLFVGIFAGFFSFIPLIGIIISLFITTILAYLQFLDFIIIFFILLIFFIGQLLESNFLTPKLIGKKLGLHPLVVLFSIFVFGALFGIVGIIFSTPLMAAIILICKNNLKINE